jgi:anti-anti-sigma factor
MATNPTLADKALLCPPADMTSADLAWMRHEIDRVAEACRSDLVLDLSNVESMDGSGIGALACLFRRLNVRGRRLTIENCYGQPRDLMRSLGLGGLLATVN